MKTYFGKFRKRKPFGKTNFGKPFEKIGKAKLYAN